MGTSAASRADSSSMAPRPLKSASPSTVATDKVAAKLPRQRRRKSCFGCKQRKIRCEDYPCQNCRDSGLVCEIVPHLKRGPKGKRTAPVNAEPAAEFGGHSRGAGDAGSGPYSPPPTVDQVELAYFSNASLGLPILSPAHFSHWRATSTLDAGTCTVILALWSLALTHQHELKAGSICVREAMLRLSKRSHTTMTTYDSIAAHLFIFKTQCFLNNHELASAYLDEALNTLIAFRLNTEETFNKFSSAAESNDWRILYWLMYAQEREYALQRQTTRELVLDSGIRCPTTMGSSSEARKHFGVVCMAQLYSHVERDLVRLWCDSQVPCWHEYIVVLQTSLAQFFNASHAPGAVAAGARDEVSDLIITKHWLRTIVWNIGLRRLLLSSAPTHPSLSVAYPLEIARELLYDVAQLGDAFRATNEATCRKLFDIACPLTDLVVLSCAAAPVEMPGLSNSSDSLETSPSLSPGSPLSATDAHFRAPTSFGFKAGSAAPYSAQDLVTRITNLLAQQPRHGAFYQGLLQSKMSVEFDGTSSAAAAAATMAAGGPLAGFPMPAATGDLKHEHSTNGAAMVDLHGVFPQR